MQLVGWLLEGTEEEYEKPHLTLSSPVMPFGIILLILFFICYNFWGSQKKL
jgi:hypothetical protein